MNKKKSGNRRNKLREMWAWSLWEEVGEKERRRAVGKKQVWGPSVYVCVWMTDWEEKEGVGI